MLALHLLNSEFIIATSVNCVCAVVGRGVRGRCKTREKIWSLYGQERREGCLTVYRVMRLLLCHYIQYSVILLCRSSSFFFFFHSLTSSQPAEYAVYKPLLILFGLVDALQKLLKVSFI